MLTLDDLLAPLGAETFLADYLGGRPAHLAQGGPPLPGWPEVAELLNMSALWSAETLSVLRDGTPVPAEEYCTGATDRDLQPTQRPVAARVLALRDAGAVLVARQVETLTPTLKRIAGALEHHLGALVAADLHVHGGSSALAPATALSDLLIAVIAGTLAAEIDDGAIPHPIAHPRLAKDTAAPTRGTRRLDARLGPGERLYVPRGCVHALRTAAPDTAYVVFSITRPVGLDLVQALIDAAVDDPLFRADLPAGDAERAAHRTALAERFAALATGATGAAADAQVDQRFRRDLGDYRLEPGMVAGATARYKGTAGQLAVVETPVGWQLRGARGAVPIPPGRERQVAWIIARAAFTRAELAAAFPDAAAPTLDELLRDLAAMKVIATLI